MCSAKPSSKLLEANRANSYASVVKRLESFFRPANYTNVLAAYVFGY